MTELLEIACYGSPLFFMWWDLFFRVYYRENDNDDKPGSR